MLLFLKIFSLALVFLSTTALSQDNAVEYKIKAAYLYNFTKFVVWPESSSEAFNLCILGKDPFGVLINPILSRTLKDKPIIISRFRSIKQVKDSDMMYFGKSVKQWKDSLFNGISKKNILLVGETASFTKAGGMIAFVLKDGKIKLQINLDAVKHSPLKISAQLLEVAELVNGDRND